MKHLLVLNPRDLLFLRDARPMGGTDAGLGANWPRPDQLYHALLSAFHLRWPDRQPWEGEVHTRREEREDIAFRFGALKTVGPFPVKGDSVFFPRPLDFGMKLVPCDGTDLPLPLKYAFLPLEKGKKILPRWVSAKTFARYFAGESDFDLPESDSDLYGADRNIGIGMDPVAGTTRDGAFYQAEYLRLRDGVSLVCEASCDMKLKRENRVLDAYDPAQTGGERVEQVVLGGQQGICSLSVSDGGLPLPARPGNRPATRFVRWTLLAPSVFNAGWKPGWLDPEGRVMLPRPAAELERRPGESRDDWRKRRNAAAGTIGAKLVAARVDRPVAFSGWDLTLGPKPTVLAVPAGSCYVFECDSPSDAEALAGALDGVPRSDLLGSNGFGIGVCSFIEPPSA